MKLIKVRITLIDELLGTKAMDPTIFTNFIASKAQDEAAAAQEIAAAQATAAEREVSGTSVFHLVDGRAGIWDYQVKGFFKDACRSLRDADGTASKDLKAYKTKIDGLIFVGPRFIHLNLPADAKLGVCERPLRADTAQGPRVGLCRSETVPAGTTIDVEIRLLKSELEPLVREWLDYGQLRGLGQWRNSGKGRFSWQEIT